MAPWADVLYATDGGWWHQYGQEASDKFQGAMYGYNGNGAKFGAIKVLGDVGRGGLHPEPGKVYSQGNSGGALIHFARNNGARRIILLGYDFAFTGGQFHWHGKHEGSLGNAGSIKNWFPHMRKLAADLKAEGVEVLNCSRVTALDCFDRRDLADALEC